MSTILDALRKVEEEKRARETDVRTRLLSHSARFDFRTSRRSRFPWAVASGLAFGGIAFGAGLMLWRSPETLPVAEVVPSQASPLPVASAPPQATSEPRRRRQSVPEPNASPTPGQSQPEGGSKEEM